MNRRARLLLGAVLLAGGCGTEAPPYAVGTLERDRIEMAAESSEPIIAVAVTEGDAVAAGAVLLTQDPARIEAQIAGARARHREAAARLDEALAGPRQQQIQRAEARLAAATSAVATARAELRREQALAADNFASQNQLDVLQGRYEETLAARQEAEAALDELREGTRPEVVRQTREAAAAAAAAVAELEIALARTTVAAPLPATVEALPLEIGERPIPGQTVAVLRARAPTFARVHVPEPLRAVIDVGSPARVHIDGHAEPLPGRVRWIATEAAFTPYFALTQRDRSRLSYLAEVTLTGAAAAALPVGVPVEVHFPAARDAAP